MLRSFTLEDPLFADFQKCQLDLYLGDPFFVEKQDHFPADAEFWLVREDDSTLARCVTFTRQDHPDALFLGWFESVEGEAGSNILRSIADAARYRGYKRVIGPMNGTTWHQYRLAEPSGRTFLSDVYHKSWYPDQFRRAGFSPIATYHSSLSEIEPTSSPNVILRDLDLTRFDDELRTIYDLSISSFDQNLFYSPISSEEFAGMYSRLRAVVDPRLVKFALDDAGREIGFMFAIPDLFERPSKTVVMKTIAVHPMHRGKGLMNALDEGVRSSASQLGFTKAIYALFESNNRSSRLAGKADIIRTYHLYERSL